jgi:hypothetical protein
VGIVVVVLFALAQQTVRRDAPNKSRTQITPTEMVASIARDFETLASEPNVASETNARIAISIWGDLNSMCRGGGGSQRETEYACCLRNKVDMLLNNLGYCYHMDHTWGKCTPRDKRARSVSLSDCVR